MTTRVKYTESNLREEPNVKYKVMREYKGGTQLTVCFIEHNGRHIMGTAMCSERDQPRKKIGRAIAIGRAYKKLVGFRQGRA